MKEASNQLLKNADFVSSRHGAILSPDWKFVKICAISPSLNDSKKRCENCTRFVLTPDIVNTPGALNKWWKDTKLADRNKKFSAKEKDEAYHEFQMFFYRMVCLSSIRVVPDPFRTWTQTQGKNPHHMSAGYTVSTSDTRRKHKTGSIDVKDVLHRPHDAYKVLFFNKDQYALLAADNLPHVLFMCDFGSGKKFVHF